MFWPHLKKIQQAQMYLTNRLHFPVRVYCNRSQMTSLRVKNKNYDTKRSRVAWLWFFTRCDVFCDLLQYTHTHTEKCNLFVLYNKNSSGLLVYGLMVYPVWVTFLCIYVECPMKMKKQNKSADVIWRRLDVICACVNQWKCTQKSRDCIKTIIVGHD